jgi:PPM family protein phosphatase
MRPRIDIAAAPLAPPRCDRLRVAVRSDVGAVRDQNEDAVFVDPDLGLFIVADGVGGLAAGEVASSIAVAVAGATVREAEAHIAALAGLPDRSRREGIASVLRIAVRAAHRAVRRVGSCESDKLGMSTTLDVALVVGHELFVAHVGDSRTYLVRGPQVAQITRDHTMAQLMVDAGRATTPGAQGSPLRHILVNALGARHEILIDLACVALRAGDQLLLCTDGLHDYFSADELAQRLTWNDPELGVAELVAVARARGGRDNITGIVVDGLVARNHAWESHELSTISDLSSSGVPDLVDDEDTLRLPTSETRSP